MMLAIYTLAAMTVATALALPSPATVHRSSTVQKRTPPRIAAGFTDRQIEQINDSFGDALELASYMITLPRSSVDKTMGKYFNSEDFDYVIKLFNNVIGPDAGVPGGSEMLHNILVSPDFPDPITGEVTCVNDTEAELRFWDTTAPTLILCDSAFTHGGISKGYGSIPGLNVPAVGCANFDTRPSWKMVTLGHIILHEYTHYFDLTRSAVAEHIGDIEYGAWHVRNEVPRQYAAYNADSYAWCATENLWTTICGRDYEDPVEHDDIDPGCGGGICRL